MGLFFLQCNLGTSVNRVQGGAFQKQSCCLSPGPRSGSQWKLTWVPVTACLLGVKLQPSLPFFYSHPTGKTGDFAATIKWPWWTSPIGCYCWLIPPKARGPGLQPHTCPANSAETHCLNEKYTDPAEGAEWKVPRITPELARCTA